MDPLSSREEFPQAATAAGLAGGYLPSTGTQPPVEREELPSSDSLAQEITEGSCMRGHVWLAVLLQNAQPDFKACEHTVTAN